MGSNLYCWFWCGTVHFSARCFWAGFSPLFGRPGIGYGGYGDRCPDLSCEVVLDRWECHRAGWRAFPASLTRWFRALLASWLWTIPTQHDAASAWHCMPHPQTIPEVALVRTLDTAPVSVRGLRPIPAASSPGLDCQGPRRGIAGDRPPTAGRAQWHCGRCRPCKSSPEGGGCEPGRDKFSGRRDGNGRQLGRVRR